MGGYYHPRLDRFSFSIETNDDLIVFSSPHIVAWEENSRRSDATFWSQEIWWGQNLSPRESDFVVFLF